MTDLSDEEMKQWIDGASYESLLQRWRFAPIGDPFLAGEMGVYYAKAMAEKKKTADHVAVSKRIGW